MKVRIAIDAMGADLGTEVIVAAVLAHHARFPEDELLVSGDPAQLKALADVATLIEAPDVVAMTDGAMAVLRNKKTSMFQAIDAVNKGLADGVVSCGSTGAFLSACTVTMKLMPGVERAALVTLFPTTNPDQMVIVLDVGATSENTSSHLVTYAKMGQVLARNIYGIATPRVGLLANGAEAGKGTTIIKEAYQTLSDANFTGFIGNVEARDVMFGGVDVLVCDGFSGNVLLKGIEGVGKVFKSSLTTCFKSSLRGMLAWLLIGKRIKRTLARFDHRKTGGAMLVGVNGIVVKAHGSSDTYAFTQALALTHDLIAGATLERIGGLT